MNQEQMNAAMEAMIDWLSHPAELGKPPVKIECAGEFDLYELHYYIFKYKKNKLGRWLLGVSGGYKEASLENCGHMFSEMEEYDPADAENKAIALVEKVRSYIKEEAERVEERKENPGNFIGYVLLEEAKWNKAEFLQNLKATWDIEDEPEDELEDENEEETETEEDIYDSDGDDTFVISYHGMMLAVSLMPGPIPDGEAEEAARNNFMWHEGAEQVKRHKAFLLVAVMGKGNSPIEGGKLLVKAVTVACKQEGVLGIYNGDGNVVYEPDYYLRCSQMMEEDLVPICNLIWFGLYRGRQGGLCGYTEGMSAFGYDEIEVLDSQADAESIHEFLMDIASYVITEEAVLRDGETIGFSETQRLPITKSKGVAVNGDSLKIGF